MLADGRCAELIDVGGVEYVVIVKPAVPSSEYRHTYTAIVGNQEMTWEAHDEWPAVPAGAWAYHVARTESGYATGPWLPSAGGHGRTVAETIKELRSPLDA